MKRGRSGDEAGAIGVGPGIGRMKRVGSGDDAEETGVSETGTGETGRVRGRGRGRWRGSCDRGE
jgi:hypothetical protein